MEYRAHLNLEWQDNIEVKAATNITANFDAMCMFLNDDGDDSSIMNDAA